jgi:hypothetical protein
MDITTLRRVSRYSMLQVLPVARPGTFLVVGTLGCAVTVHSFIARRHA